MTVEPDLPIGKLSDPSWRSFPPVPMTRFRFSRFSCFLVGTSVGVLAEAQENPSPPSVSLPDEEVSALGDAFRELLVPHGLTAEAAAELAKARAPSMRKAQAGVDVAQARAREARTGFFGRTEVGYRYTRITRITNPNIFEGGSDVDPSQLDALAEGVTDPNAQILLGSYVDLLRGLSNASFPILQNRQALFASFTYPVSDVLFRVLPGYRAADHAKEASELELVATTAGVERDARIAYFEYARALSADLVARQSGAGGGRSRSDRALVQVAILRRFDACERSRPPRWVSQALGVRITEQMLRAMLGLDSADYRASTTGWTRREMSTSPKRSARNRAGPSPRAEGASDGHRSAKHAAFGGGVAILRFSLPATPKY